MNSPLKRPPLPIATNKPHIYKTPQKTAYNSKKVVTLNKTGSAKKSLGNMLQSKDFLNATSAVDINAGPISPDVKQDLFAAID